MVLGRLEEKVLSSLASVVRKGGFLNALSDGSEPLTERTIQILYAAGYHLKLLGPAAYELNTQQLGDYRPSLG